MTQPTRNLNVTPAEVAGNGQAPAYVDLAIRQAELTRTSYALQAQYTSLLRDLTTFLCRSIQPKVNGCQAPSATYDEHALVIRQMSDELGGLAEEIAKVDGELAQVKAELAGITGLGGKGGSTE